MVVLVKWQKNEAFGASPVSESQRLASFCNDDDDDINSRSLHVYKSPSDKDYPPSVPDNLLPLILTRFTKPG